MAVPPARQGFVRALTRRARRMRGGSAWIWAAAAVAAWIAWRAQQSDAPPAWSVPRPLADHAGSWTLPGRTNRYEALRNPEAPPPEDEAALAAARQTPPPAEGQVRVAAVQFESRLGNVDGNRAWLARYVRLAAAAGARLVAMPEAAVPGLADPERGLAWTKTPSGDPALWDVSRVAEPVDGPSARFFGALCRELGIYLAVTFIERDGSDYFSAAVLLDPDGRRVLHARKRRLSTEEFGVDEHWAAAGALPPAVAATPYGRVGILIRQDAFDAEARTALLRLGADLVLNPTSLEMGNVSALFESETFWKQMGATRGRMSWVLANWAAADWASWSGHGSSCVYAWPGRLYGVGRGMREGVVLGEVPRADRDGQEAVGADGPE